MARASCRYGIQKQDSSLWHCYTLELSLWYVGCLSGDEGSGYKVFGSLVKWPGRVFARGWGMGCNWRFGLCTQGSFPLLFMVGLANMFCWQILKDATTFFASNMPIVAAVIPAINAIDKMFATGIIDKQILSEPIHHALTIGKKTLNKYYTLTDKSHIYWVAMGKLFYFLSFKILNWLSCSSSSFFQARPLLQGWLDGFMDWRGCFRDSRALGSV